MKLHIDDALRAKTKAYDAARQRRREHANRLAGAAPVPTLDGWYDQLAARAWSQTRISTRERRQVDYDQRLRQPLGRLKLDRLSVSVIETWLYDRIRIDDNRRCVQGAYETLRLMLDAAVLAGLIYTNPVRSVPYPLKGLQTRPGRALNPAEYAGLLDTCRDLAERVIMRLLTEPGLRISEAVELHISDIDLDSAALHVQRRAYHTRDGARDIDTPKSRKTRHVAIPRSLANDLRRHLAARDSVEPDAPVLTRCSAWTHGEHLPHTTASLRNQVYRLAARAGIDGVHPHALRATGATIAAHRGVPHVVIQAQLGHSRIQTTERYIKMPDIGVLTAYADVFEGLEDAA